MNEKKHNIPAAAVSALFLVLLILGGVGIFLFQRESSEVENRSLQTFPQPSADAILSGEWQEKFETFTSDQFPFRDAFNAVGVTVRYALGSRLVGGAVIGTTPGGEVRLFEEVEEDAERALRAEKTVASIDALAGTGVRTVLLAAPSAGAVYRDDLPAFATVPDAEINAALAGDHKFLTVSPDFAADESLYFRTDHHWTARGAELAYRAYAEALGKDPVETSFETVSDSFFGTLHSRAPLPFITPDVLEAPTLDVSGVRVRAGGGFGGLDALADISLYSKDALDAKDKYQYFLGGNYGLAVIENESVDGGVLFVFKDSFANCFVPYLTRHYEKIVMVDPRYYRGSYSDLCELFRTVSPDDVLVLYEASNLANDKFLSPMLDALAEDR